MVVVIDGKSLTIDNVAAVALHKEPVHLSMHSVKKMRNSRSIIDKIVNSKQLIYGVNTGVGKLANVGLAAEKLYEFQRSLIRSHAIGCGKPISEEEVRAMMLIRANQLAKGYSCVRPEIIKLMIDMLNQGVAPVVYENGSVGASGDLGPLAHMALVMQGEGEAYFDGEKFSGIDAMKLAGIKPIQFEAKEGLAVINGPMLIAAIASLLIHETEIWIKQFEIVSALTLEALQGNLIELDERGHMLKNLQGQVITASNLRRLTAGSQIMPNSYTNNQDPYSLRCIPQIVGPAREVFKFAGQMVQAELNSASDNPLVFGDKPYFVSTGNFQGTHMAFGLEALGIAITTLCVLSERRMNRLLDPSLSKGLPPFLVEDYGLNSGFMELQILAVDVLAKNKVLTTPAATQSLPVSANQEDFNSMGLTTAVKTREILNNAQIILCIELLLAAQGLDFRRPKLPGKGALEAYKTLRRHVEFLDKDRALYKDVELALSMLKSGKLLKAVEVIVNLE